jgi:hypothetical protein
MCGGICTISSQNLSGPAPLSHHITTHPKGTLAEVAGTAEICGSGSLTLAAVRLQSQNSKTTVTVPNASHARKNNRKRCISITRAKLEGMLLEEEYRESISSLLRDCKYPVNSGLSRATSTDPEKKGRTWGRAA